MSLVEIKNFIGGEWVRAQNNLWIEHINPSTGFVDSKLPRSSEKDVDQAVQAARLSFKSWSRTTPEQRSEILVKIAEGIEKKSALLAEAESRDQGKPLCLSESVDIPRSAQNFRFFAGQILYASNEAFLHPTRGFNFSVRKPIGVAGLISPWNLPLYLLTWKIAPALACGNTVVAKPSELTSMTAFLLTEILKESGVPPGVVNLIFGLGSEAGDALVKHPDVPVISFTGGTQTGKTLSANAAPFIKKLSLELGGKNANIIFADAPLKEAIATSVRSSFLNQGEICLCGSRIFVERSIYQEFLKGFVSETKKLKVGNPFDKENFLGALVSEAHFKKVQSYIALALKDGAQIEAGEEPLNLPLENKQGYFMRPTILSGLTSMSRVMQEEIFGPVVGVVPFDSENEVIEMTNSVPYGLSASLWTENLSRVQRLTQELEVGTLWVNTWMMRDLRVPFGGMKMSGLGREGGLHSLDFFSETTNVCIKKD